MPRLRVQRFLSRSLLAVVDVYFLSSFLRIVYK